MQLSCPPAVIRSLPLVVGLLAACAGPPELAPAGRWHVSDGYLRDAHRRAAVLRGLNLSGEHKQSPYLGFHQAADYDRVGTEWGFNALRFLIVWAAVEPIRGQYDGRYLDEVARRMDWAGEAGLAVVLDMHQDVYGEGFGGDGAPRWACDESLYAAHKPVTPWFANYSSPQVMTCFDRLYTDPDTRRRFAGAWREVAARLKHHPAVVGFDVLNEPHWGSHDLFSFERERLAPFYDEVVRAVRAEAPHWVAFLEPASSRNLGFASGLTRRSYDDVVYAPHSYDALAEAGAGFEASRRPRVVGNLAALADEARRMGAALWIGEYGGVADDPGIGAYMDAQYDGAAAVSAGGAYWDYSRSGGYGLLGADSAEKPVLLEALVRPYPARVAGQPSSFAYDEASRRFTLTYRPDRSVAAPTEIVTPARVYPAGYVVECGGCAAERAPGRLLVRRPPVGATEATLTVTPAW